jgi:NitT/TauT family transport system substrate-binding protein
MNEKRRSMLRFLGASGAAGLTGIRSTPAYSEPPPETTRLRLSKVPTACLAPQYVAEELLRAEGFTEVEYIADGPTAAGGVPGALAMGDGAIDFSMNFAAPLAIALDRGASILLLGGVHVGCFELIVSERVRTIGDLKGKTAAVLALGSAPHVFLASIVTSIGLDPNRDIHWVTSPVAEAQQLLAGGKIDAFLAFPPDAQELRAKKVGRVLLNSAMDRPWSQYFCCMVSANRDFVRRNPVAAKRALRAILKGSEICASSPDRAAKAYLDLGYKTKPDYVRQALREIPYGHWRDYNPEETVRFYALRLREAGMVKSSPQNLIAQGTDWRFLDELKKELKA